MLRRLFAVALLGMLSACAVGPEVRVDYDRSANFARYRTFAWANPLGTDRAGYTTITTERLKAAVGSQMIARGYTFSATDPDLLVNFHGRFQERLQVTPPLGPPLGYYGYRTYGAWPGYGFAYAPFVDQYTEGTINVDLVDRRLNQLVWEGVAMAPVTNANIGLSQERIDTFVNAIFARYPFRAGSGVPVPPPAR